MTAKHRALVALAALAVTTTASAVPAQAASNPADGINGTWQSAGYGQVFDIKPGSDGTLTLTISEQTSIGCVTTAQPKTEVSRDGTTVSFGVDGSRVLTVRRDGDHLLAHVLGTVSDIQFDQPSTPPACSPPATSGPEARLQAFDIFWQTLTENYPTYEHRPIDWKQRDTDRSTLVNNNTEATLKGLFKKEVGALGDYHTQMSKGGTEFAGRRPGTRNSEDPNLDPARVRNAISTRLTQLGGTLTPLIDGGSVEYADGLPGGVGYLRINSLENLLGGETTDPNFDSDDHWDQDTAAFNDALDKVFTTAQDHHWTGIIVDLRLNGGGFDQLGLDLASRLTESTSPKAAYQKRARNLQAPGGFNPTHTVTVQAGDRPGFHGKVTVLTSDLSASAAETTTVALLNTVSHDGVAPALIGSDTQGAFSDQLVRTLPDGWSFSTSNEDFQTPDTISYEGTGVPVRTENQTPVFTKQELDQSCDSAIARALSVLGQPTPACGQ